MAYAADIAQMRHQDLQPRLFPLVSMLVASLMFVALLAVTIAHLIWALGRTWPIRDERLLARTVVGSPGAELMPPRLLSLGVALGSLAAGVRRPRSR